MARRCEDRVSTPEGTRRCMNPPQEGMLLCHQHANAASSAASESQATSLDEARLAGHLPVGDIGRLVTDEVVWGELLEAVGTQVRQPDLLERMAHKDLYVTEAIRHAIVPSKIYPDVSVAFKGGTSLSKAHSILYRFSEDVDVNIIPPMGQVFGDARRKKVRRELHDRLDSRISLPMTHERHGTNFATTTIRYPAASVTFGADGPTFGEVLVEMNIRSQPPGTCDMRSIRSLVGDAATELDPALLDEYVFLRPFEVLTADPIIAVVDKFDALHWRGTSDDPTRTGTRARDIYDLACLLRHESVVPRLNSDLIAEMHEIVVRSIPPGLAARAMPRPHDGFASSVAFQPGHPACEALRDKYPAVRSFLYADEHWIHFDDALEVIHGSARLI